MVDVNTGYAAPGSLFNLLADITMFDGNTVLGLSILLQLGAPVRYPSPEIRACTMCPGAGKEAGYSGFEPVKALIRCQWLPLPQLLCLLPTRESALVSHCVAWTGPDGSGCFPLRRRQRPALSLKGQLDAPTCA